MDKKAVNDIEQRLKAEGVIPSVSTTSKSSGLGTLYPSAKSADERYDDDERRQRAMEAHRLQMPALKLSLLVALLFFVAISFAVTIQPLWFFGQMAGVFFSFVIAIALGYWVYGAYYYADSVFYSYEKSLPMFLWVYILVFSLTAGLIAIGAWLLPDWSVYAHIFSGAVLQCLLMGAILSRLFRRSR